MFVWEKCLNNTHAKQIHIFKIHIEENVNVQQEDWKVFSQESDGSLEQYGTLVNTDLLDLATLKEIMNV